MAYMLYKYIRRRVQESKAKKESFSTVDNIHLSPYASSPSIANGPRADLAASGAAPTQQSSEITKQHATEDTVENERLRQEARRLTIRRWKLMAALVLPNFLAAIDVTIVAPAIPTISSHFSTLSIYTRSTPVDKSRQTEWKLQLDRSGVYAHVHHLRSSVRSACRRLREACRSPVANVLDLDWQRTLRIFSHMGNAPVWKSAARLGSRRDPQSHSYHPVRRDELGR